MRSKIIEIIFKVFDDAGYGSGIYKDSAGDDFVIVETWDEVHKIEETVKDYLKSLDKVNEDLLELHNFDNIVGYALDQGRRGNWGFSDEYTTCSNCDVVICTSPDSYFWVPGYYVFDGSILCSECVKDNPEILISELVNNPNTANTILSPAELEELGFKQVGGEYETGLYGIVDDPKKVFEELTNEYDEILFNISEKQQFTTYWTVWVRVGDVSESA